MLPKGVGGGRGPLPAVVGGGHRPPKAVGAGHGGSVPRRNRLSVRLPVHNGGGRLQCPKVRRGKVGGRVPPTLYRLMVWKWNQETVYIRFPLLSVVCVGRSQKKGIAKTLYPLFSITIELTNCFLSITNDKTVCLFVFLEEVFFPLSSGT